MVLRWERYHQEILISKVKNKNCLWDSRHPEYRSIKIKQALFEEIAVEMDLIRPGTSVDDVKKRWGNLRCQYSENIRASKGKEGIPRKLWCKDMLTFLQDVTVPRSQKKKIHTLPDGEIQVSGPGSLSTEMEAGSSCEVASPDSCCFSPIRSSIDGVVSEKQRKLSDCVLDPMSLSALNAAPTSPSPLPPLRSHSQDAIDKYAHCVASELRQIRQSQQLVLAKWHIQNILFQAQFGMLVGPPATLAFSSGPTQYTQDTLVNWQQSTPIQVISSEGDAGKEHA